jgi:hypothetical protein
MKKSTFNARIQKLETAYADWDYSLCKTTQDKLNWKGSFCPLLDTTRVFFFAKTNTVVLVDRPNGYKKHFKNPSLAIKEIRSWADSFYNDYHASESEKEYA